MKVCVSSPSFSRNSILVKELRLHFPEATLNEEGRELFQENLLLFLTGKKAAIIGREKIDATLFDELPELRYISKYGVGLDNIDLAYAQKKGVQVSTHPGTNRRSVAELALCFLLGLARNIFFSYQNLKQAIWIKNGGQQLSEKRVGIIGCGNTGKELIQLLLPLNCVVLVNDIEDRNTFCKKQKDLGQKISLATKEEIYTSCDFISLHVPLTKETHNMIGTVVFEKMQSIACIVNTSRGGIIEEVALQKALLAKDIAGAALDVFEEEPITNRGLLLLDNLVCTPHIGGNAKEAILAMGRAAIQSLYEYKSKIG